MLFCYKLDFFQANFTGLDYSLDQHNHQDIQLMKQQPRNIGETSGGDNNGMIDYMLNNPHQQHQHQHQNISSGGFCSTTPATSFDKLSFADVMQFADFGPKLALNQTRIPEEEEDSAGIDPAGYFLRFPVLNDKLDPSGIGNVDHDQFVEERGFNREDDDDDDEEARISDNASVQLHFLGGDNIDVHQNKNPIVPDQAKNKRKRPRTIKTSEEVESQRMTHIAVERNRRKQMNEHLRVLRSLMPGSYVQRVYSKILLINMFFFFASLCFSKGQFNLKR